jgi:uncharacterized protein (TIGR00369 family)
MTESGTVLDVAGIETYLHDVFPQMYGNSDEWIVEAVGPMTARLRLPVDDKHLRPGGTISGPTMFTLADLALYVAILAQIGPQGLAVTTNLSINFLRKPPLADLVADCRLLKLGARLAVGEVWITSGGEGDPVAHATGTYSIPPR